MRIAVVQCPAIADDLAAACALIGERLRQADAAAVDLILFPEAFLLGHAYDAATIHARACEVSRHGLAMLCRHVAGFRATLVVGAFEATARGIFNSAFVIARGRVIGRYAKAYPNEPGVVAGAAFPIFRTAGIRYGINICNDANHADAAAAVAAQGASLILYPLNNMLPPATAARWRDRSIANLVARARETSCWVASADVTGAVGDRVSHGCTAIVAPDGRIVARVAEGREGMATYDAPTATFPPPAR